MKRGAAICRASRLSNFLLCLFASFLVALRASALALAQSSAPSASPSSVAQSTPLKPPAIDTLVKPPLLKRVLQDREIFAQASLSPSDGAQIYTFKVAMLVSASPRLTREVLTDYRNYSEIIPYIDLAQFSKKDQVLLLEGGIWGFHLRSRIFFSEPAERWVHYKIIEGHFAGLEGDIFFESRNEKGTLVYFRGEQTGNRWPPRFVIERGAEIVFGFTATRMRRLVESRKAQEMGPVRSILDSGKGDPGRLPGGSNEENGNQDVPQPRPRFQPSEKW